MKTAYTFAAVALLASLANDHAVDAFAPVTTRAQSQHVITARNLFPSDPREKGTINSKGSEKDTFFPFHSTFPGDDFTNILSSTGDWSPGADNGWPNLLAPAINAIFTTALIFIIYDLRDVFVNIEPTIGSKALALVTGALIWDNLVISLGSIFCRDIETNEVKHDILKFLSWPRFTLHAVAVPLQCITIAEMGNFAGVGILQSDLVQTAIAVAAFALAIQDRTDFVQTNGIELTTWEDSPPDALERDLVKFGYKVEKFKYVIPAIILSLSTLVVGIAARGGGGSIEELAGWLIFAGLTALVGNSVPGSAMTFTGNLGEVCMQFGLLEAARIVYYH